MSDLLVDPRSRRRDIGRALLDALEAAAVADGANKALTVVVDLANTHARNSYDRVGMPAAPEHRVKRLCTVKRIGRGK